MAKDQLTLLIKAVNEMKEVLKETAGYRSMQTWRMLTPETISATSIATGSLTID